MANKAWLIALGTSYLCTKIKDIKRVKLDEDININNINKNNNNLMIFLKDNNKCKDMLLLSIDRKNNIIKVIDFNSKFFINNKNLYNLYNNNGVIEVLKAIDNNKKLGISGFVTIDYKILKDCIDKIGGLEMKIATLDLKLVKGLELRKSDNGIYQLQGAEAVEFITNEKIGKTSEKHVRQKKVIRLLIDKIFMLNSKAFINTLSEIISQLETNLSVREVVSLGLICLKIGSNNILRTEVNSIEEKLIL